MGDDKAALMFQIAVGLVLAFGVVFFFHHCYHDKVTYEKVQGRAVPLSISYGKSKHATISFRSTVGRDDLIADDEIMLSELSLDEALHTKKATIKLNECPVGIVTGVVERTNGVITNFDLKVRRWKACP